jgi:hypothetical protein
MQQCKERREERPVPKWKKDATEFPVRLNYNPERGIQCFLPKPIFERLGRPQGITFVIKGKKILVVPNNKAANTNGGEK